MRIKVLISLLIFFIPVFTFGKLNPRKFYVWGPGLDVKIVLPVRYFWVQPVDENGKNTTTSLNEGDLSYEIVCPTHSFLRIYKQLFYIHDGSYLLRFRMHQSYKDLSIIIRYKGELVGDSPYHLDGNVYDEECDCPLRSLDEFIKDYNCSANYSQIIEDFKKFPKIDMKTAWKEMSVKYDKPYQMSAGHYVIKDNELYLETLGKYVGFQMFSNGILHSLLKKIRLPDMEFVWNYGDWPLTGKNLLPLISWCGSTDSNDFVLPTYDIATSTYEAMYRTDRDMLSMQFRRNPYWKNKTKKAFWRGRDSSKERLELVQLSTTHPDLIDAKLTHVFFFTKENLTTSPLVPFFEFFNYTYQISMDGTVAGYRFPYLLSGGSVVFKQDSHYYEHFYKDLKPFEHYIPLQRNISDLLEKLQWARDNDEKARKIALNAYKFSHEHLLPEHIYCYHAVFFKMYAERLVSKVELYPGMEHKVKTESECDCPLKNKVGKIKDHREL